MMTKEEIHNLLNKMYQEKGSYITFKEVCKTAGCCEKTFRMWMKATGSFHDCPDVFRQIMKTIFVFDELTPEAAYWIGYLMADGCYAKNSTANGYRLMLECKTEDKEILEKFCDFVGIRQSRITSGHQGASVALSLADSNFSTSVSEYGIIENKSHKEHLVHPEIYQDNTLFLQYLKGLIDGDGTIHTNEGSHGISIIDNSKQLLNHIKDKLETLLPTPSSLWLMKRPKEQIKQATQDLFVLKIGVGKPDKNNLQYIYHQFYDDQPIILTRKEQLLRSIL